MTSDESNYSYSSTKNIRKTSSVNKDGSRQWCWPGFFFSNLEEVDWSGWKVQKHMNMHTADSQYKGSEFWSALCAVQSLMALKKALGLMWCQWLELIWLGWSWGNCLGAQAELMHQDGWFSLGIQEDTLLVSAEQDLFAAAEKIL